MSDGCNAEFRSNTLRFISDNFMTAVGISGGNYMQTEYSNKDHGRGLAGSLDFSDYGDDDKPRAFAFLKFETGAWQIYFQKQNGVGLSFNNNVFTAMGPQTVRGGGIKEVAKL